MSISDASRIFPVYHDHDTNIARNVIAKGHRLRTPWLNKENRKIRTEGHVG